MGFIDNIRQAAQMRSEQKRIQAEIEKITTEYSNGGITVVARGDMSIISIKISDSTYAEVSSGKHDKFETMLFNVVNGALKNVKKATQEAMLKMLQANGSLPSLFGK